MALMLVSMLTNMKFMVCIRVLNSSVKRDFLMFRRLVKSPFATATEREVSLSIGVITQCLSNNHKIMRDINVKEAPSPMIIKLSIKEV